MPDKGKTLDALDVVQGTAEDKVVGVRRGTRRSPKQGQVCGRGTGYTSKPKTRTRSWAWDGEHVEAQDTTKLSVKIS